MKIVLCNQNAADRESCKNMLEQLATKHGIRIDILSQVDSTQVLFNVADLGTTDLIYLDIPLGELDGIALAKKLREMDVNADLVFFSADKSRVFEAFDVDALHYLVKDETSDQKFEEVFLKAKKRSKKRFSESILFSCAGERRRVAIEDILYFEVSRRIITVYYGEHSFEFYSTMAQIEETLFNKGFCRVHRAFLVAEKCITAISQTGVEITNGKELPVGRQYYTKLRTLDVTGVMVREND